MVNGLCASVRNIHDTQTVSLHISIEYCSIQIKCIVVNSSD